VRCGDFENLSNRDKSRFRCDINIDKCFTLVDSDQRHHEQCFAFERTLVRELRLRYDIAIISDLLQYITRLCMCSAGIVRWKKQI
jgi:hypothetical protein